MKSQIIICVFILFVISVMDTVDSSSITQELNEGESWLSKRGRVCRDLKPKRCKGKRLKCLHKNSKYSLIIRMTCPKTCGRCS
ncbi:unnamed protein product [Pocillopora meandrina]|uniref:ShKT domain-containing protein n=1 Tax=Pocillopora meandrina TaxID=46732 RepID=A0AAU9WF94_9CNID|nr:unnamed protein product [Pocillopora meandrina]